MKKYELNDGISVDELYNLIKFWIEHREEIVETIGPILASFQLSVIKAEAERYINDPSE